MTLCPKDSQLAGGRIGALSQRLSSDASLWMAQGKSGKRFFGINEKIGLALVSKMSFAINDVEGLSLVFY